MKKRSVAALLVLVLCFNTFLSGNVLAGAAKKEADISIHTVEELLQFAKNCSLDSWSQGKTITLEKDLDLEGVAFSGIPTFGGTFDGRGHTIRGLSITTDASHWGFFRTIQEKGLVKDVTVEGKLKPTGGRNRLGGLVGVNYGTVTGCTFHGTMDGRSYVGGIAGVNEAGGEIANCRAKGTLYGISNVGGIVGENYGSVVLCANEASINTTVETETYSIEEINMDTLRSSVSDITNLGGVAGNSKGILQSCTNKGTVGYQHVGYNVGGIVGMQSGYINACTNRGKVYGRKDVGGIAGQMEPYSYWLFSESMLNSLQSELDTLESMIDAALDDTKAMSATISSQLNTTQQYVDDAKNAADSLVRKTGELANREIETINDISSRIADISVKLEPVVEHLGESFTDLASAAQEFEDAMNTLSELDEELSAMIEPVEKGIDQLSAALREAQTAINTISSAIGSLRSAIGDPAKMQEAFKKITNGLSSLASAQSSINQSIKNIYQGLNSLTGSAEWKRLNDSIEQLKKDGKEEKITKDELLALTDAISQVWSWMENTYQNVIRKNLDNIVKQLAAVSDAVEVIAKGAGDAQEEFSLSKLTQGLSELENGMKQIASSLSGMADAAVSIKESLPFLENASQTASEAVSGLADGIGYLQDAALDLEEGTEKIREAVSEWSKRPAVVFEKMDQSFSSGQEELTGAISNISSSLSDLNTQANQKAAHLMDDFKAISDQLFVVIRLLVNTVEDVSNQSTNLDDYIEDVSQEDTENRTEGKVEDSINYGKVNGDVNTGGIAGAMAIEIEFDPEDDLKPDKLTNRSTYQTRDVIRGCENYGSVTGKKDAVGGIAGQMKLGMIYGTQNYGTVVSLAGNYVGGIVGEAGSHVTNSYSKCTVSGQNYVGGIAGYVTDMTKCYAMVHIAEGKEFVGEIAGEVSEKKGISKNYFVQDEVPAIDGVSYQDRAEPLTYENFISRKGIPQSFRSITITFLADGEKVDEVICSYGDTLSKEQIPEVPKKEGYYGVWDVENFENLHYNMRVKAKYAVDITVLASEQKRDHNKHIVLMEGIYTNQDQLTAKGQEVDGGITGLREQWSIKADSDGQEFHQIRYLPEEASDLDKVTIYLKSEQEWKKVKTEVKGSYVCFTIPGDSAEFAAAWPGSGEQDLQKALIAAGGALAVFLLLFAAVKAKRKKRRAANNKEKEITNKSGMKNK